MQILHSLPSEDLGPFSLSLQKREATSDYNYVMYRSTAPTRWRGSSILDLKLNKLHNVWLSSRRTRGEITADQKRVDFGGCTADQMRRLLLKCVGCYFSWLSVFSRHTQQGHWSVEKELWSGLFSCGMRSSCAPAVLFLVFCPGLVISMLNRSAVGYCERRKKVASV